MFTEVYRMHSLSASILVRDVRMLLYIIHLSTILLLLSLGDNKVSYHKDNIYTPQSFPTPFQHPVQLFPFLYLEHASRNLVSCGNGILLPYCPSKVTV